MVSLLEFFPHHPEYDLKSSLKFNECYYLANSVVCPNQGHRPASIVLDRGNPKKCAICFETEETTTFESVAHILPASVGNRHHTSLEECDQCNLLYGKEYEHHFALWLNPERTFFRIRRQPNSSPPDLKGPNGSSIEVDGKTGVLAFKLDSNQVNSIVTTDKKEIEIPFYRPACNKVSAIRSMLKTAWLLLTPQERIDHPLLLKLIKKELNLNFWNYWELNVPENGFTSVHFEVWKKRTDININVALAACLYFVKIISGLFYLEI